MASDEWSPDEALGTESYRQGDVAEDEGERTGTTSLEDLEQDPSLDPTLMADELEIEELGAQLDDPERLVTLQGGIDDPDGIDGLGGPPGRPGPGDEGWDLDEPLVRQDEEDATLLDLE
jgi:hypothetical protein